MKPLVALVTAREARGLDEDMPPLEAALHAVGAQSQIVDWDDAQVDWGSFDVALLRSTWDYTDRLQEFLAWVDAAARHTTLLNPPAVVRWNTDKHYLAELARAAVPVVPSTFIEPGESAEQALQDFLARHGDASEFVVKPSVGAGSRDTQRLGRTEFEPAVAQARRLLSAGRSVLLQPYLDSVDRDGETALIYVAGQFSHAIRKGPLLPPGAGGLAGCRIVCTGEDHSADPRVGRVAGGGPCVGGAAVRRSLVCPYRSHSGRHRRTDPARTRVDGAVAILRPRDRRG